MINIAPVYQYQDDNLVESVSSYMVKHEQEISEKLC